MEKQFKLWQPSNQFINQSNLKKFERWLQKEKGLVFKDYTELWQWSIDEVAAFWEAIWEYFEIISHHPYTQVLENNGMPMVKWFEGATLNYAEHIFRKRSTERPAMIFQSERERRAVDWQELEAKVAALRNYLESRGVGKGDRVAGYLPNIPEAIIAFLATNSLGAIWSCCSPDFGVNTVIDRFAQIEPKILFAVDGYPYNNKPYNRMGEVEQLRKSIPGIEQTVFIPYLEPKGFQMPDEESVKWDTILKRFESDKPLEFTPVPFDHPIWILYSSGTTGKPKAITHSHGGVLLEHLKYMAFHNDVHPGENFFWFTTTGWMMWNFLQASMLMGATPILYDGSPGYPNLNALWKLSEELPIHHFGTSAPYLVACMKQGLEPGASFDLSQLRSIGSTGAPLPPEAFDWVYEKVSREVWLCSMSGGTDVCTAFVGGCPYEPVYRGAIQCRALGCALKAYDDNGQEIHGSLGEMVIEQPMTSMPIYFWNDEGGKRYHSSYFSEYPGKWRHGDWVKIFPNGSLIIQGRSDATLNRKGIRIGTAEIYAVIDGLEEVKDSLILNLEKTGGEDFMPLFVVLKEGLELTHELEQKINLNLRRQCSPRHVPDEIILAPDIPYTLSGKKMEVPIKKLLMGMDISANMNKDAVRNPEALAFFMNFAKEN